jgi:hypothetical protein
MWTAPQTSKQVRAIGLTTVAKQSSSDMFSHSKSEPVKKATASRPSSLPRLYSTDLFKLTTRSSESDIHWLHSTSIIPRVSSHSQTWMAPPSRPSAESADLKSNRMWEPASSPEISSSVLFSNPHVESWRRKRRESMSVKAIQSAEMWKRSAPMPESPKHWLVDRRISRVEFRY